jgi:hypothetical protein
MKKARYLSHMDVERAKNYFNDFTGVVKFGQSAYRLRQSNGIGLATLFRVIIAAIECTQDEKWREYKVRVSKMGAGILGMQVCLVPYWVQVTPFPSQDGESHKCNADCMRHPETPQMCAAYKAIAGLLN